MHKYIPLEIQVDVSCEIHQLSEIRLNHILPITIGISDRLFCRCQRFLKSSRSSCGSICSRLSIDQKEYNPILLNSDQPNTMMTLPSYYIFSCAQRSWANIRTKSQDSYGFCDAFVFVNLAIFFCEFTSQFFSPHTPAQMGRQGNRLIMTLRKRGAFE